MANLPQDPVSGCVQSGSVSKSTAPQDSVSRMVQKGVLLTKPARTVDPVSGTVSGRG
jgi:hypothetical protein